MPLNNKEEKLTGVYSNINECQKYYMKQKKPRHTHTHTHTNAHRTIPSTRRSSRSKLIHGDKNKTLVGYGESKLTTKVH